MACGHEELGMSKVAVCLDSTLDWQPVYSPQDKCYVFIAACSCDYPSCRVLNFLEFVHEVLGASHLDRLTKTSVFNVVWSYHRH